MKLAGKEDRGKMERYALNSAPSAQNNGISDLLPFIVHSSVVYQQTNVLHVQHLSVC